ncbi:MAG: oxygen-independent coproporphyrinogen III oxidase [Candidatus Eisenbacteria bacterium]|uniref:Coproporphyrinogen-III oxidase n=1 Tax=Eiseniibacteriota bacterium TaxID=2212470 RepID=A0A538SV63_UNCEI|nr:MAG: oxygen-independent coproporphyrinogen III oxidase [Candidatus Eisenbacteria bacterium]
MNPPIGSVTADLLAKYDRAGPRYTSYPTAVEFHEGFTPERYLEKVDQAASRPEEPLSVYVHLPFCRERCSFCGCNVIITQKPGVAADYIADLVSLEEIERVWRAFADRFTFEPGAEIAIEVDPRVTTHRQAELLRRLGFNRISMGVQDFDSDVQEAVNRYQTFNQTKDLHEHLRGLGIESINFDFIYGLPQQTPESFRKTIQLALELRPDRVAVYSYAFVPWIKAHQKAIRLEDLPAREVKLELFGIAHELFTGAGYQQIGMDHFALETDSLARAAREHTLYRNFMGYTTHPARDFVGFGVSAIGDLGGAFAQNTKKLNRYKDALDRGRPPIERGFERSRDDEIRRDVIQSLMCNFYVDIRAIERAHGIEFATYFRESLLELDQGPGSNGFVIRTPDAIEITGTGRLFVRNICMAFDAYLKRHEGEKPVFSRTV